MRIFPGTEKKHGLKPKSLFGQILMTLLGCTAAMCVMLYVAALYNNSREMSRQMVQSNTELVTQTSGTVDQMVDNLSLMLYNTFMSPDVIRLAISPDLREFENMKAITDALTHAAGSSTLIDAAFLYSARADLGLSSDYTLSNYQDYSYAGVLSRFQTRRNKLTPYEAHGTATYIYTENSDIYLIQGFSNIKYEKCSCYLLFHLNTDAFYQTINSMKDGSMMFYNNAGGRMFVSTADETQDKLYQAVLEQGNDRGHFIYDYGNGTSSHIMYQRNARTGWMCIYATEESSSFATKFLNAGWIAHVSVLLCCAMILAAAFWSARRISRPISTLVQKVQTTAGEDPAGKSEWEYLEQSYSHLLSQKEELEHYLPLAADAVHGRLFRNLLRREAVNHEWLSQQLSLIRSPFSVEMGCGVIRAFVELDGDRMAQELALLTLRSKISAALSERNILFQVVDQSVECINVVYALPQDENTGVEQVKQAMQAISLELGRPVWGISGPAESLLDLGDAMEEAKNDLEFNQYHDSGEAEQEEGGESTAFIGRIRNLMTTVQEEDALRLAGNLDRLIRDIWEGLEDRALVRQMYRLLFDLLGERVRNFKMDFAEIEISLGDVPDERLYERAQVLCEQIMALFSGHFSSGQYLYVSRVTDYIQTRYNDPGISLESAAEYVGINSAYLSRIFKSIEGKNFSTYLNEYRVENARKLLETTDMPAQEVGYLTGFCSVSTFFRVFKKHTSMTPKQYRQNMRGEEAEE